MSANLPAFYQNAALKRTSEVADADWDNGGNKGGSCACGVGINTGNVSIPAPPQYTLLDQAEAARDPQDSQHIGTAVTPINVVRGADVNDTLTYEAAAQQAADGVGIGVAGAEPINRTGDTVEIGDVIWGTNTVA